MDKFKKVVIQNKYEIKNIQPLPNVLKHSTLEISFDNFLIFIKQMKENKIQLPLLSIKAYDQDIILSQEDFNLRYQFLQIINKLNIKDISFNLSDSTMPVYNAIMQRINWKHSKNTKLDMSIDRNSTIRKDLKLESAKGKILLDEEKLIWCSVSTLEQLKGKVDERILKDAIKLKDIVFEYYSKLNKLYHVEFFTDFDKIWLTYNFIKKNISFANEATKIENGKQVLWSPNNIFDWASQPLGTFQHKKGVCSGQARLMTILLNNPYMKCNTTLIKGECNLGRHGWSGTVVNGKLYQTCLTMGGVFADLNSRGYIPDQNEIYPKIYDIDSLSNEEIVKVQSHIKKLKK